MSNSAHPDPDKTDILEQNVSTLLETGGETPRMADTARSRIRAELVQKYGAATVPARSHVRRPVMIGAFALAAAAVIAVVAVKVVRHGGESAVAPSGALADGSTVVTGPGGKVTVLGERHVRVEGEALLDVMPGKGQFIVETAQGKVTVLGTKFYVRGDADRTVAAVVRGKVLLASSAGEVLLHAGEQGIAQPGQAPVRGPAPRLSQLASWAAEARNEGAPAEPLHHGSLFARDPGIRSHPPWGQEYPLPIAKLGLDIVVEDRVARVALDQTFHNDADQDLEGVYRFAIPPDAALQRLAMYVDGHLEESAVVERMQARRIYEELVYRRIDPALLEWAGSGRLSLRVYPIPARQDKRLVLAYTQSLPKLYDDWTLTVPLPEVDQPAGELAATVRVKGCGGCEITSTSHEITVEQAGEDAVVHYQRAHDKLGDSFVLHVRDKRRGAIAATQTDRGDSYLMVRAPVALDAPVQPYQPHTWVILDDVSASRSAMELRAQQDLIDSFLKELDEDDTVSVVAFDVAARTKLQPTRVREVDRKAVRDALANEGGVGATDFQAGLAAALQLAHGDATVLYLGDGVITAGPRELDALRAQLAGKAKFVGVGVGDGPDTQTLGALAAATGGYATTFDLSDDLRWRAFDLVAALHTARVTGVSAKLVDASGALVPSTLYLASPQLADGEELEAVAKLAGAGTPAALELDGMQHGAPWHRRIELPAAHPGAGYLPRLWAQRHIAARLLAKHEPVALPACAGEPCPSEAELREARDEGIRKEVVALGKKFFLLSRHTSLIVLENDAMYARYGVAKGAGETWAPYALPATIPVVATKSTAPLADVAADAELVRTPLQIFYDPGAMYGWDRDHRAIDQLGGDVGGAMLDDGIIGTGRFGTIGHGAGTGYGYGVGGGGKGTTRATLGLGPMTVTEVPAEVTKSAAADETKTEGDAAGEDLAQHEQQLAQPSHHRMSITSGELYGGLLGNESGEMNGGYGFGVTRNPFGSMGLRGRRAGGYGYYGSSLALVRMTGPSDPMFDDASGFVPALFPDAADAWRARLGAAEAGHSLDAAAKDQLERARRALPSGLYRWGERELAIDDARRIGWRTTSAAGLAETASIAGTAFTRRYGELDLDVTRSIGDDDVALALGYLPLWIAEPAHYARYFDVTARGAHEVAFSTRTSGKAKLAYVLAFDDRDHLVAIRDAAGATLVQVTWSANGPTAARVDGEALAVSYTPEAIADATAWAHGNTRAGVVVELPLHLATFWQAHAAKETAGSPEWRRAQRQLIASLAATQDRAALYAAYHALREHGGAELGDLALAAAGLAAGTNDAQFANELAQLGPLAQEPLARYLVAGRAYGKSPRPDRLAVPAGLADGLVSSLWQLRAAGAQLAADHGSQAVDALVKISGAAPELRLIGVSVLSRYYGAASAADLVRAEQALATGPDASVVREILAQALYAHGDYDRAAEMMVRLAEQLDLHAPPPNLASAPGIFGSSRRGAAGWQLVYAGLRDRVLAGDSYAHVLALLTVAAPYPGDIQRVLARAAQLADGDAPRLVEVARLAAQFGQGAWAEQLIAPLVKKSPSRPLYQLAAQLALAQGKAADALADLEAAQDAGADEQVDITVVRAELGDILTVARQLAQQSTGTARDHAVARALEWGRRWRAIDAGNPAIDETLGELLLSVGDTADAWRQLSSTIERDPWSGAGYTVVAEAFERQGKVSEALPFWHQAVIIDQTNPTPRLREAQALIALGRPHEGDAILEEISRRHWHDAWSGVVYQAKDLLARGHR